MAETPMTIQPRSDLLGLHVYDDSINHSDGKQVGGGCYPALPVSRMSGLVLIDECAGI
jgi:hypothetical protein